MGKRQLNNSSKLIRNLNKYLGSLFERGWERFALFLIFMAAYSAYAQSVPIPNPNWPLDSVVNTTVHKYTVYGDQYYDKPSSFVWNVKGGTLYYDANATIPAFSALTDTVLGDSNNRTIMYVKWELYDEKMDTGYVYVYEISSDNCQRPDTDEEKYQGRRLKITPPPVVWFLKENTLVCSYQDSFSVDIAIKGIPPYDLEFSENSTIHNLHIEADDLIDSDNDGKRNNLRIVRKDFTGTTTDMIYQFELIKASSGGVPGYIVDPSLHTVLVFAQPAAPDILPAFQDVTANWPHYYSLQDPGIKAMEWYWELLDINGQSVFDETTTTPTVYVPFKVNPGNYVLVASYQDSVGCISLADSMDITVYAYPSIAFTGDTIAEGCSWSSVLSSEDFVFNVHYEGAPSFSFSCKIYDYSGIGIYDPTLIFDDQTSRDVEVRLQNNFVNNGFPEKDRIWRLVITEATNEEGIEVPILDSDKKGGRDERYMLIHQKPIVKEDIDFAN